MKTKLSPRFWCALTLFSLIGQVAWVVENMYLNVFIYKMFHASAGDISAMVAASAVAATLTTVLMGALSDKVGKRKVFMCAGYILWGVSVFCFALLRLDWISSAIPVAASAAAVAVSLTIILDCVMTFFGSSANDAAFNAWLTDSTDDTNRGAAEGINSMMPLVAILVVFGGFMAFDLDRAGSWTTIFAIIGGVVTLVGVLGIFLIDEVKLKPTETGYLQNVIYGFRPSTARGNKALYVHLAAFILFNISIQIFMPYLIIYYEVSLGMTNYVLVMAPAIILASVVTAFWGRAYDRKGFRFSSFAALIWLMLGYVVLYLFRATLPVFAGSLLMMCGYLSGMAVFGAKIRDLTPSGKAGMLQGVRIFSQVLVPGVVGPWIGKTVLANAELIVNNDGTTSFVPNANIFLAALVPALIVFLMLMVVAKGKPPRIQELTTPFESDATCGWTEYPRPQMKRDSYLSLCGAWELSVMKGGVETALGSITVPYPPESRISGIGRAPEKGEKYRYCRSFRLEREFNLGRILLHFGAVDHAAEVWVNGEKAGKHAGGYLPFTLDITELAVPGDNELLVEVTDELSVEQLYGKQRAERGGMWYTPISGIWQSVWLESVPEDYIRTLKITPALDRVTIETTGGRREKTVVLQTPAGEKEYRYEGDAVTIPVDDPILWTPDAPQLYHFTLTDGADRIASYFALRTMTIEKVNGQAYLCLNGKPTFFHGLLDQGYYSDGIYTPATPEGYRFDILTMKKLGFNMLRKHIKIEPDLFYYYCDKYGMVVFQDMINSGRYHWLVDTALPTLGMKKGVTHRASPARRAVFESSLREMVELLYNHPCVCYYTIFNEGWGQYDADRICREMREVDPTRVWDATSGWFTETESDVVSEHIYFRRIEMPECPDRPLVLSEFGGYSWKIPEHSFNLDQTYGYKKFEDGAAFTSALEELYREGIIPAIGRGLCAAVLTQVSDVEDETNGLVTYDRQMVKVDEGAMSQLAGELYAAFEKKVNG